MMEGWKGMLHAFDALLAGKEKIFRKILTK